MTKKLLTLYILLALPSLLTAAPFVDIQTNHGIITVELQSEEAPGTVDNFLHYVDTGFYDNTLFHRVIDEFMIQGGGWIQILMLKKLFRLFSWSQIMA